MSVYNGQRYLRLAVESILSQKLGDFEFIIINDGSTDGSAAILEEYSDQRLKITNNDRNLGLAYSLNRGISIARCSYIARQDADDVSDVDRLHKLTSYLDEYPETGVVASAAEWIDTDGLSVKIWPSGMENVEIQKLLLRTCPLIHGSTVFRRECFNEVGGYDVNLKTGQDYDLWLRISETWDLTCIPDILYRYRQHQEMASIQHSTEQSRYAYESVQKALVRRRGLFGRAWSNNSNDLTRKVRAKERRWLARRYVWWAAGARAYGRNHAVAFLLRAFLLAPLTPEIWNYVGDLARRKIGGILPGIKRIGDMGKYRG